MFSTTRLILFALIVGIGCQSALAQDARTEPNDIERRAFEQTNLVRIKNGLPPFVWDGELASLSRNYSENMSRLRFFSHTSPDGKRLPDRARAAGIVRYSTLGENIAYNQGYEDPGALAVARWMESPKHRANILSSEFRAMAIGSYVAADGSVYLTQTFIKR